MRLRTIGKGLWGAIMMSFFILFNPLLRRWHLRWGCTEAEAGKRLPGDELVPEVKLDSTHGITIQRPAKEIWPWLVQIGADRGGFYSFDLLENLVGCRLKSADRLEPRWQNLSQGDSVSLHPKAPRLPLNILMPDEHLVLGEVWGFHLIPVDTCTTRLLIRARGGYNPRLRNPVLNHVVWHLLYEPVHFVMERRMMKSIKELAERGAQSASP